MGPNDGKLGDFFGRQIPALDAPLPDPPIVPMVSPRVRKLVTGPTGLVRVIVSANSRAVIGNDGTGRAPGNYVHGFIDINRDRVAGILNRPAITGRGPWFGYDCQRNAPFVRGAIESVWQMDFSRFWTSGGSPLSVGPGRGLLLRENAEYALRCQPEGLIRADEPLVVRAHLLRFPGASIVSWAPNKHTQQNGRGINVQPEQIISLDTTRWTHQMDFAAGDSVDSTAAFWLAGDQSGNISAGDAAATPLGGLSLVQSVWFDADDTGATQILLVHPLRAGLVDGMELKVGPLEYETVTYQWDGLTAGDPAIWRGLYLRNVSTVLPFVIVYSFDAWRPDVDGFLFGAAGWGGAGYSRQIAESFPEAIRGWISVLEPDVWLQMPAQQESMPDSMSLFTALIRQAAPECEIAWLGDPVHERFTSEPWQRYIMDEAAAEGVVGAVLIQDPRIGDQFDQWADGLRIDGQHISRRGNALLATIWTEMLDDAALPCEQFGDIDGDGAVTTSDLVVLLGQFGLAAPVGKLGDLDETGDVTTSDLVLLLGEFGRACTASKDAEKKP